MDPKAKRIIEARARTQGRRNYWPGTIYYPGRAHPDFDEELQRNIDDRIADNVQGYYYGYTILGSGIKSGPREDKLQTTLCAMLICGHPRHGAKCELCDTRWQQHSFRNFPGEQVDFGHSGRNNYS